LQYVNGIFKEEVMANRTNYIENILRLSQVDFKYLNYDAIFSDETENYRYPSVPVSGKKFTITLRVGKDNIDSAYICYGCCYVKMQKNHSTDFFDYYEGTFICDSEPMNYYFQIICDSRTYFYNKAGVVKDINSEYNFTILPDFSTPSWAKGAVMYQIYVDRFYNGDKSNDVVTNEYEYLGLKSKHIEDWDTPLENMDVCNFYGGDLQGVIDKMDYLSDLGIDAIYFNPIFVSPSNHKYDIQDYEHIDPHYGVIVTKTGNPLSNEDKDNKNATLYMARTTDPKNLEASDQLLAKLIGIAHSKGIKVILDGVFNHCGAFNKWLDREGFYEKNGYPVGAYASENSPYHNFFNWTGGQWPNNEHYSSWWDHPNHPKLNYEHSDELYTYIMNIARKWVSPPYNADGWRLDVAADLGLSKEFNMKFWRDFRKVVKNANPNAVIIAEHYGDPKDWLMGDQWDTVMNYDAFMEPITWFLTGMEKHSEKADIHKYNNAGDFEASMRYYTSRFSNESLNVAMNQLSNHDHSRFLTRTNRKTGRLHTSGTFEADTGINLGIMKEAITFQMTWPGAPTIYYGDEIGMTGWTDPDNRRPFRWDDMNEDILSYHKCLINIRHSREIFKSGSLDYLYMGYGLICYGRWNKNDYGTVILNNQYKATDISVPVWRLGAKNGDTMISLVISNMTNFIQNNTVYIVKNGCIKVSLPPFSSCVIAKKI
jgi:alpha-glucosidase